MPFLSITSNADISPEDIEPLLIEGATICCEVLGKPADYMQTAFNAAVSMTMGSRQGPCVLGEVRSQVSAENIYLVFQDVPRDQWAWNGKTFG